jgi:hypothetical protein
MYMEMCHGCVCEQKYVHSLKKKTKLIIVCLVGFAFVLALL